MTDIAYLSLGSNLGDRRSFLESAVIESISPEDLEPLEEEPEEIAVPEPPDAGELPPPEDIPLDVVPLEPEAQ